MLTDAIENLDHQLRALLEQPPEEFAFAAAAFLEALQRDPRVAIHLDDLACEADDLGRDLRTVEYGDGVPGKTLDYLWDHLGNELRPEGEEWKAYMGSRSQFKSLLGDFDHPVVVPLDPNAPEDTGRVGQLLKIVDRLDMGGGKRTIDRHGREMLKGVASEQAVAHTHAQRTTRIHTGVALVRLRCVAAIATGAGVEACSRPRQSEAAPALKVHADAGGRRWSAIVQRQLAFEDDPNTYDDYPRMVAALRASSERLGLELRRRLGTTRSRLGVIERFRARCEWHDRERMRAVATEAQGGQREHALRDELTRYLFDQGLNPLSEAQVGASARADVFDPSQGPTFFVEAKQYGDSDSLEAALRGAFRQALDTAGTLHGPYAADEVFIVLFRRSGPNAILPKEPIVARGLRWHFVLINIAPSSDDASKNRAAPVEYGADQLRSILIESEAPTTNNP